MDPNLQNVSNEIVNASAPASAPAPGKPKSSKGAIATIILLAILAIGGIAGAIYFYMDANNKATENAELSAKLDLIESETGVEVTEKEDEDGNTTTVVETKYKGGPFIENGYFYVPDWGWKFKIPTDLASLGFAVDYDEAHTGYDLPFIGFTAVQKSDLQSGAQSEYYDDILSCSIIEVNKTLKSSSNYTPYTLNEDSIETDDYVLRISNYSSGYCSLNLNTAQVYEKLKTMFQNPEEI